MDTQITTKDAVRTVFDLAVTALIFQYVFPMISGITISGGWVAALGLAFGHTVIAILGAVVIAVVLYATGILSKEVVDEATSKGGFDMKTKIFLAVPVAVVIAGSMLTLSWLFPGWIQVSGWAPALIATAVLFIYGQVWSFLWKQLG